MKNKKPLEPPDAILPPDTPTTLHELSALSTAEMRRGLVAMAEKRARDAEHVAAELRKENVELRAQNTQLLTDNAVYAEREAERARQSRFLGILQAAAVLAAAVGSSIWSTTTFGGLALIVFGTAATLYCYLASSPRKGSTEAESGIPLDEEARHISTKKRVPPVRVRVAPNKPETSETDQDQVAEDENASEADDTTARRRKA